MFFYLQINVFNIYGENYAADVIAVAQRDGFQVHSYADDTQLYFHVAESSERRMPRFTECIAAIESWMTANRLKINTQRQTLSGWALSTR